jgi:hypothetical protein
LIEQKVSFIVPGNQLYLPDLGLDLREYFRQRAVDPLSLTLSLQQNADDRVQIALDELKGQLPW